jgi:hypothetical protein
MIAIDFQGGAHGNYLEFVCNKLAGITKGTPFNKHGASHSKQYTAEKIFVADHYSFWPKPIESKKVISIQIQPDDLLPLQQISLLRAGDFRLDNNLLENETFNKLNNVHYRWVLDCLIDGFFKNQIKQSYDAVKDPSWPEINSVNEFLMLPEWIQQECKTVHNLVLLELNEQNPNCPKHILRSFFQIGFRDPDQHGFIERQKLMQYTNDQDVFVFPFSDFYDTQSFLRHLKNIANWAGLVYNNENEIVDLHNKFLTKQLYRNSKNKCDMFISQIKNGITPAPIELDMLEEAYINAKLGKELFT